VSNQQLQKICCLSH